MSLLIFFIKKKFFGKKYRYIMTLIIINGGKISRKYIGVSIICE